MSKSNTVVCPICQNCVPESSINDHIDKGCAPSNSPVTPSAKRTQKPPQERSLAPIFSSQRPKPPTPSSSKRTLDDDAPTPTSKRSKLSKLQQIMPLAEKLRPKSLKDFVGQEHILGDDSFLVNGSHASMIFWGPPGCGKTTLARLFATENDSIFKELSATVSGVNEVRAVVEEAKRQLSLTGRRTILFLDEVHRFNKAQQDIFLPYVEQGYIQLIGATTENPSFRLTSALLSRCRVFVLERLSDDHIRTILLNAAHRAAQDETVGTESNTIDLSQDSEENQPATDDPTQIPSQYPQLSPKILSSIISLAAGDARLAISLLDLVLTSPKDRSETSLLTALRRSVAVAYDRTGESHYDMISALHKSVRGSQPSAALYWLARMLNGGEDPLYIARRMVVCASEDIGLADNHALPLAMATFQACQVIGMPECRINLAHLVSYLAEAPKSTRAYEAYNQAEAAAKLDMTIPVPMAMRNAPTELMKDLGYGATYRYNPDYAHPVYNEYWPSQFRGDVFLRKEGDLSQKIWDEDALRKWEIEENGGRDWEGRPPQENPSNGT